MSETDSEVERAEFNGEGGFACLLINHSPKIALSRLVNSGRGVSS